MKPSPALICLPDISGFTKFMSNTSSDLNTVVIPMLLNKIVYANEIDLKVSEIEGDAVLFYRYGALPSFEELTAQCKLFFREFYKALDRIMSTYSEHDEINEVPKLGLKIVMHYGTDVKSVQIGNRIKLMGEDVIIAHRLLKNSVPDDEYILFSEDLLDEFKDKTIENLIGWQHLNEEEETYKHLGEVNYNYIVVDDFFKAI